MCLIIAIFSLVFSVSFFMKGNILLAFVSGAVGLFFIALMIRNIRLTLKERNP